MRILKHLFYAILLGVSMVACLSQDGEQAQQSDAQAPATTSAQTTEQAPVPAPANFIIAQGRVGNVHIGTLIEDMRQQVPTGMTIADTTLSAEGIESTAYVLHPQSASKGILIEQQCEPACHVWRLTVQNSAYRTSGGIGIGSKYGEVQQAYPITYLGIGEGNLVAVSEEAGFSFILNTSQLDKEKLTKLTPTDVPANTLVKGLLLY